MRAYRDREPHPLTRPRSMRRALEADSRDASAGVLLQSACHFGAAPSQVAQDCDKRLARSAFAFACRSV